MAFISPRIADFGLFILVKETTRLTLTAVQAVDYPTATVNLIGEKVAPFIVGPSNADPEGTARAVVLEAFDDGQVRLAGEAGYWALVDDTNVRLLLAQRLVDAKPLVPGNTFGFPNTRIVLPLLTVD